MDNLVKLLEETNIDGGDIMLTLADRLRKEGRQETTWEIIKNALKKGLSLKTIEEITGIPADQINLMKEKMAQS